jgi:DNA polymerase III subunit gamma/tau
MAHLARIAGLENASLAPDAMALITRAAEGSVRDAMSLMDQAIAHGAGETTAMQVRSMLGLADRGRVLDLFDMVMRGDAAGALTELSTQYADGADPMAVLRDLAEVTHWISVIKITPMAAEDPTTPPDERSRGLDMAERLPMRVLSRTWQMLLKAIEEVALAPNAMMAAEMAIIRLTHVADMPDPETLLKKLSSATPPAMPAAPMAPAPQGGGVRMAQAVGQAVAVPQEAGLTMLGSFDAVVALIRDKRDMKLLTDVEAGLRLVAYAPGRIEFEPAPAAARDLAARLSQRLQGWTGARWGVSVVSSGGAPTLAEAKAAGLNAARQEAAQNPLVQAVLAAFPGAKITEIRNPEVMAAQAAAAALPEVEDEWDPFEDS